MPSSYTAILGFIFITMLCGVVYALGLYRLIDMSYYVGFDTLSYNEAANQLMLDHTFHPYRCIGYPIILVLSKYLFSNSPYFFYSIYLLQIGMWWFVIQLQFRWLKTFLQDKHAFLLLLLTICNVSFYLYAFFLLTEMVCLFFLVCSFEQIRQYIQRQQGKRLVMSACFYGIAVLCKPGLFPFLIVIVISLLALAVYRKLKWGHAVLFCLGALVPLCIQWLGMYQFYNQWTLSYISDITYYRYLHTSVLALQQHQDILPLMQERDSLVLAIEANNISYQQFATIVSNERTALIQAYPGQFIQAYAQNLFSNFHTGNTIPQAMPPSIVPFKEIPHMYFNVTRVFNMVYIIGLVIISFIVFYFIKSKKGHWNNHSFMAFILIGFCLFAFLLSGVSFYQGDRFNIIWMPLLVPAFVFLWYSFFEKEVRKT